MRWIHEMQSRYMECGWVSALLILFFCYHVLGLWAWKGMDETWPDAQYADVVSSVK